MSDEDQTELMEFVTQLRNTYINNSGKPTLEAILEFDSGMTPLVHARMTEIQKEEAANRPTQAQVLMELVIEVESVVALVPPKLRSYRDKLAAEGLDRTVVPVGPDGKPIDPETGAGGREGMPGINLADQAALEFHSQLLSLAFGIAQDEVQQRLARQAEQPAEELS